jgi:hypothetical protein
MTTFSTDFTGGAGALGAGDGITQMNASKTLGRNGSGQAVQSAGDVSDVNVMVNGSFAARQFARITLGNAAAGSDSYNVAVHLTSPGAAFTGYTAFVDNTTPTLRNLEIWKYTAGVGARLGAAITIPAGSEPTTADDLYVEISADASPVIDVSRVRAGVFLLLGSRTDAASPFTSGNPGFGTFWDGLGTAPLLDAAAAGDFASAPPLLSKYSRFARVMSMLPKPVASVVVATGTVVRRTLNPFGNHGGGRQGRQ